MKTILKILKTPSESRTQKQCQELLEQIGELQFFRQYNENPQTMNVPKLCCKYMEIENFEDGEVIFEIGSVGNKFYVVLQGSVGIFIKKAVQQVEVDDKSKAVDDKNKAVDDKNKAANALEQQQQQQPQLLMVKQLGDGSSFGELALLNNKPRLATIQCLAPSYVATLSKENFNRILKEHEDYKLKQEILFFEKISAFSDLNTNQIRYLCLNNRTIQACKNDVIFDEKHECDSLFVIKEGEFEIYKSVDQLANSRQDMTNPSTSVLNKNSNHKFLKRIKIKVLSVGEMIGEEFLLNKKQRDYRMVCSSASGVIVKIKASDFLRRISDDVGVQQIFFKRFKQLHEENEERVQKRIQQFLEFKNYLVEDRLPAKLKQSMAQMYANNKISNEENKSEISEFRQQILDVENMHNGSELQSTILSQSALTNRFNQATSIMFANQIQYLKYKRLSMLAADQQQFSARNHIPPHSKFDPTTESSTSSVHPKLVVVSPPDSQMKIPLIPQTQLEVSLNELESESDITTSNKANKANTTKNKLHREQSERFCNISRRQSNITNSNTQNTQSYSLHDQYQMNCQAPQQKHISESQLLGALNPNFKKDSFFFSSNVALKKQSILHPSAKDQSREYEVVSSLHQKSDIFPTTQITQFSSCTNAKTKPFNSPTSKTDCLVKNYHKQHDSFAQLAQQRNESIPQSGTSKSQIMNAFNNGSTLQQKVHQKPITENDTGVQEPQIFMFSNEKNEKKRALKPLLSKDNFIRDWKKNSESPYEDAQQQSLIRKIKRITTQSGKYNNLIRQSSNQNDSIPTDSIQEYLAARLQQLRIPSRTESTPKSICSLISLPKIQDSSTLYLDTQVKSPPPHKKTSSALTNYKPQPKSLFIHKDLKPLKRPLVIAS